MMDFRVATNIENTLVLKIEVVQRVLVGNGIDVIRTRPPVPLNDIHGDGLCHWSLVALHDEILECCVWQIFSLGV